MIYFTDSFYRKAYGILLLFDVTNRMSFISCQSYLEDIRNYSDKDCLVYLVGNKIDLLKREVLTEEAKQYAAKENIVYIETSAIKNTHVTQAFQSLVNDIYKVRKEDIKLSQDNNVTIKTIEKPSEGCCF